MRAAWIALWLLVSVTCAYANDSAVESAPGGLRLRKERSVLMEKERLVIGKEGVEVEYEFRNTGKAPVVSEVAFPIAAFHFSLGDSGGEPSPFKLWVNDKPVSVATETRAFVKGREVTKELKAAGITIETFGNFPEEKNQLALLSPQVRKRLLKVGALEDTKIDDPWERWSPEWEVEMKYHWRQEFPVKQLVKIRHSYYPRLGSTIMEVKDFKEFKDACLDRATLTTLERRVAKSIKASKGLDRTFLLSWISYILTTANSWQTPINDFELVVQRDERDILSFCWEGPLEKVAPGRYRARMKDFIPTKDLKVYFMTPYLTE